MASARAKQRNDVIFAGPAATARKARQWRQIYDRRHTFDVDAVLPQPTVEAWTDSWGSASAAAAAAGGGRDAEGERLVLALAAALRAAGKKCFRYCSHARTLATCAREDMCPGATARTHMHIHW